MAKPKIAFLTPVAEVIPPVAFQYAAATIAHTVAHGASIDAVGVTERTLIHTARNQLAKGFLESDNEWAFWWDCDIIMPKDTILRLLEVAREKDAKMVTGIYYQRLGDHMPVLWSKEPELEDGSVARLGPAKNLDSDEYRCHYLVPHPEKKKPLKADVAGFGCMLTHRSVVEKLAEPWFKTITGTCSEDFYFCMAARKAGFQLWADPSLRLGHISKPMVVFKEHLNNGKDMAAHAVKLEA